MNKLPSTSYANELRLNGEFSDIVLKVAQRSFPCHRIILACTNSRFFRGILSMPGTGEKENVVQKLNPDDFELILTHIYGGSLSLSEDEAFRFLRLSIYLDLKTLEELCTKLLIASTSVPLKTVLDIFEFACDNGLKTLLDAYIKRVVVNFDSLSKTKEFLGISQKQLLKILTHPDLTTDVGAILNCIVDWMEFQSGRDENLLTDLLSTVDVPRIPKEWIEEKMKKIVMVSEKRSRNEDERTDDDEINFHVAKKMDIDILKKDVLFYGLEKDYIGSHEMKLPFTLFLGGQNDCGDCINVCKLLSLDNHQSLFTINHDPYPSPQKFECCKAALVNDLPFMLTVYHSTTPSRDDVHYPQDIRSDEYCVMDFDGERNEVHFQPYLFDQRSKTEICSVRSYITFDESEHYNSAKMAVIDVEVFLYLRRHFRVFNCEKNSWTNDLSEDGFIMTEYSDLLTYLDNLYVIGGQALDTSISKEERGKTFQQFDRREGKWSQLPKMKFGHLQAASCVHNDVLYVSGGSSLTYLKGTIESFDFKAGRWGLLETSMTKPKMNHKVIAHNDHLWFFGGENYNKAKTYEIIPDLTWYSYDLKNSKWSDIFSVPKICDDFKTREIFDVLIM